MNIRNIILFFLLNVTGAAYSQEVPAYRILENLMEIVERDFPGYRILHFKMQQEYKAFKTEMLKQAKSANQYEANVLCNEYLSFFKASHCFVFCNSNKFDSSVKTNIYLQKKTRLPYLSGTWRIDISGVVVNIRNENGRYAGFVLSDDYKDNDSGFRFLVLYPAYKENYYNALTIASYGVISSTPVFYSEGRFFMHPGKVFMERVNPVKQTAPSVIYDRSETPSIKILSNRTLLFRIPSLFYDYKNAIDSLLNRYDSLIKVTDNLVIDLRNNAGGSVLPTYRLIKYLKSGRVHFVQSYLVASDSLIADMKRTCAGNDWLDSAYHVDVCNRLLPYLEANRGRLVFDTAELYRNNDTELPYPKNVALVIDRNTASAAELFVLAVQKCRKVKVFGEYSAGGVDYGGALGYQLAAPGFYLNLPSEMAEYIREKQYESVGIKPDVMLRKENGDWVEQIRKYMEKN
jgi:hypothetical protein